MKTLCAILTLTIALTGLSTSHASAEEDAQTHDEYVSTADSTEPLIIEEDNRHNHVREFPVVNHRRHGDEARTKFVYLPGAAVVRNKSDDSRNKTEVLDIPFFTLAETERRTNGEFDNKAVDLPLFGPLFRHKRVGDKEKVRFFIFSHTRRVDPDKYGDPEYRRPEVVRHSRGKGGTIHRGR